MLGSSYACILRSYRPEYPVSMLAWDVQAGIPLSCYFWIFFKNWKWLLIGKKSRVWLFTSTACACNSPCQQRRNKCFKKTAHLCHTCSNMRIYRNAPFRSYLYTLSYSDKKHMVLVLTNEENEPFAEQQERRFYPHSVLRPLIKKHLIYLTTYSLTLLVKPLM